MPERLDNTPNNWIVDRRRNDEERASGYTHSRGSMTVEAAVAMPLFLFAVYLFWLLFTVLSLQVRLQSAADQVSGQLAQQCFLVQEWRCEFSEGSAKGELGSMAEGGGITPAQILSDVAWKAYARSRIVELVGEDVLDNSVILSGTSGISLLRSSLDFSGDLDLCLSYKVQFPSILGFRWKTSLTQHSVRRCWTGSQSGCSGSEETKEEMVYVTDTGTVYHRDISCYHLNLTIREVSLSGVGGMRNNSGAKYYPCERCSVAAKASGTVFIAKEGNRYHMSRDCAGLKRTVHAVPLSGVGKRACSNCGKVKS